MYKRYALENKNVSEKMIVILCEMQQCSCDFLRRKQKFEKIKKSKKIFSKKFGLLIKSEL